MSTACKWILPPCFLERRMKVQRAAGLIRISRGMALCCIGIFLLLLTTFPLLSFAGRRDPRTTGYESSAAGAVEVIASRSVEQIAVAAEERMMHYPHKLQNGIRRSDFMVWKDKQQPVHGEIMHAHRRVLVGSSAPTCRGSCGLCQPCQPVHVVIGVPHVAIAQQEYYPEVWRCACGNMLYIP
ncbi:unnamed protein product [Sphagnum balticum]